MYAGNAFFRPRLEGKPRTPLSSRVATRVSWSPLSGLKGLGTLLGSAQWKRASSRGEAGTSGFLCVLDSDCRVPAELGQESQASSCVEEFNSSCLSSCSRGDRPLVELSVEPAGFSGRCTGVSVSLRVVPSSTGLPSGPQPLSSLRRAGNRASRPGHIHSKYSINFS